jgi:hypothetical protein
MGFLAVRSEFVVLEVRVLRRIFGLNREEITGGWRKLHEKKLHHLYRVLLVLLG